MAYKLTNHEKETIIIFNEAEQEATVTTYNSTLIRKLDGLCSTRTDDVQLTDTDSVGGKTYTVPKKWIKVNANRILDEEAQARLSLRAEKMRESRSKSHLS